MTAPCVPTWGTYKRHLRNGERCERCLAWVAAKVRGYRAAAKERAA